jgi:hypothetical protein
VAAGRRGSESGLVFDDVWRGGGAGAKSAAGNMGRDVKGVGKTHQITDGKALSSRLAFLLSPRNRYISSLCLV